MGEPVRRGVALAASVLELVTNCTLDAGAGEARGRSSGGGAPGAREQGHEAVERHPAKAALSCGRPAGSRPSASTPS